MTPALSASPPGVACFPTIEVGFPAVIPGAPRTTVQQVDIAALRAGAAALRDNAVTQPEQTTIRDAVNAASQIGFNIQQALSAGDTAANRRYLFKGDGRPRTVEAWTALVNFDQELLRFANTPAGKQRAAEIEKARGIVRQAIDTIPIAEISPKPEAPGVAPRR